ncbi:MAG TPA: hypothetical protein VGK04_07065 [Thermoanaerobaculia bacterium]
MDMDQIRDDISYVRNVTSAATPHSPSSIPLLWAAIVAVGFPLADFAPSRVGVFWMIAGPVGFLASGALGWWDARRRGQLSASEGARWMMHWGALVGAIFLASLLLQNKQVTGKGFGALVLLLLSLTYFLAGVHLEGRLRWIGLLTAGGYIVTFFFSTYVWTIIGGVLALSLVISAVLGGPKRA